MRSRTPSLEVLRQPRSAWMHGIDGGRTGKPSESPRLADCHARIAEAQRTKPTTSRLCNSSERSACAIESETVSVYLSLQICAGEPREEHTLVSEVTGNLPEIIGNEERLYEGDLTFYFRTLSSGRAIYIIPTAIFGTCCMCCGCVTKHADTTKTG
jgi:hypothetical protein